MGVAGLFISHFHQGLVLQMEDAPWITQLTSLRSTAQQGSSFPLGGETVHARRLSLHL